jgi:C4-dicarboxylate transporter, DctM subunit
MTIFVIVFGGIYGGIFSPTEGAAVGAAATLLAGIAQRELSLKAMERCFVGAAETSAMVFMIFLGADMMNSALALTQMPAALASWMSTLTLPPVAIIGCILLLFVALGCVMDELSMLLLCIPVLFPAVMGLELWGLSPEDKAIWFGILVLMVVGIGLVAPPVGLNVYVVNSLAKDVPMNETYKGVLPFLASDLIRTVLLLFFPAIALGLVKFLM